MIETHGRVDEQPPTAPLRFGIFLPPMHPTGQNPTLLLQRDLHLIEHLDELGYDEAWIGEHHSSGFETIASPEVFIAAAAGRRATAAHSSRDAAGSWPTNSTPSATTWDTSTCRSSAPVVSIVRLASIASSAPVVAGTSGRRRRSGPAARRAPGGGTAPG